MKEETITIKPGDTLWGLAEKHLGDPYLWTALYARNKPALDKAQRVRGFRQSQGPDLIYEGTEIVIPVLSRYGRYRHGLPG